MVRFPGLVPLCSPVAPNGVRVGRDDRRRGGLGEGSIWEPAAHAALCAGLRAVLPLLPSAPQHVRPTAPPPSADRGGRCPFPTHASCAPSGAQPPGAGRHSGPRRARGLQRSPPLAPERPPRALRPRAGGPRGASRWARRGVLAAPLRGPRPARGQLEPAPRGPPSRSRGPGGGVLGGRAGGPASRGTCARRPPLPARPAPARLAPPRALSTGPRPPLPVPAGSSPPPPRRPHFLGAAARAAGAGRGRRG